MAMNVGGSGGAVRSEINITPLVDVVLVLLIIFMVIQPILQMGYDVDVPPKGDAPPPGEEFVPDPTQIMLRIDREGKFYINKEQIAPADFPFRLSQTMQGRSTKMVFFAGDGSLPYEKVSEFLDLAYNNGATNLGIVLDDIDETGSPLGGPAGP
jgi:biopolymer transport protein TolR